MCDQQSLRSACAYAQSDQSLCLSLEYAMTLKLLTEHHLDFLSLKGGGGAQARLSMHLPKCHLVGNRMSWLKSLTVLLNYSIKTSMMTFPEGLEINCYPEPSSPYIFCICQQRRLWRVCTYAHTRQSLRCLLMRYVPKSRVLVHINMAHILFSIHFNCTIFLYRYSQWYCICCSDNRVDSDHLVGHYVGKLNLFIIIFIFTKDRSLFWHQLIISRATPSQ